MAWLRHWFCRIFRCKLAAPESLRSIEVSTETVNFTLPNTRVGGAALAITEIALVRFLLQSGTGVFTQLVDIPNPTGTGSTSIAQVLAPGPYVIRGIVIDKQVPAVASAAKDFAFTVPAVPLGAPMPLTTLTVVVT
jgi:hypothetical protein